MTNNDDWLNTLPEGGGAVIVDMKSINCEIMPLYSIGQCVSYSGLKWYIFGLYFEGNTWKYKVSAIGVNAPCQIDVSEDQLEEIND